MTSILHETLQGIKIIKAFTMEKEMSRRYEEALAKHYRNTMREVRISEFSTLMTEILGGLGIAVILFYGSNLVISGRISPGEFFSFIAAVLMNRGRIVQQGSHEELMAQGGLYQDWYAMQFSKTTAEDIINK